MRGKQLPKELQGTRFPELQNLKPYTVHMIDLVSFKKTIDGYCHFHKTFLKEKESNDIFQKDIKMIKDDGFFDGVEKIYLPLVSFDGYNVLMLENISQEALLKFSDIAPDFYREKEDVSFYENYFIDAYSLDEVLIDDLTLKGINQYRNALEASENFEALIKLFKI